MFAGTPDMDERYIAFGLHDLHDLHDFAGLGSTLRDQNICMTTMRNNRVCIGGATTTIRNSLPAFSWLPIPLSGILSEGDKRDSKSRMPESTPSCPRATSTRGRCEGRGRGYFAPEPATRTRPRRIYLRQLAHGVGVRRLSAWYGPA